MITKIVYGRLFNLGNYENERLEVEVTIEGSSAATVEGAWKSAQSAIEQEHARLEAEREATRKREREEYEARERQRRAEYEASRRPAATDDSPPF